MFKIGDKIVYPRQGIGTIVDVAEKNFTGKKKSYYIIEMYNEDMEVMIPVDKIENFNIRFISDEEDVKDSLEILNTTLDDSSLDMDTKERVKVNTNKINSGSLMQNAEVVSDLSRMKKEKNLNASEKQILQNAKRNLIDEITNVKGISEKEAESLIDSNII